MTLRLQNKNLYLTYLDTEERIFNEMILITELAERLDKYVVKYAIACKEVAPTTGTVHYHCLICCENVISTRNGKVLLTIENIMPHVKRIQNNLANIVNYIKKDGSFAEVNKENAPRKKQIEKREKAELMMNGNLEELFLSGQLGAIDIIRAQKLKSIFQMNRKQKGYEKKLVLWFYGESGEGKTRLATELAEQFDSTYWLSNEGLKWFDGFENQEFAVIDDFRKSMLADWSYLLRLLDGYSLFVQIKGGFTTWNPKVIIITSPATPQQAFQWTNKEGEQEQWDKEEQLLRRLMYNNELQIYEFPLWEEKKEQIYQTLEEHLKRKRKTEEENMMPEEWSIIEPEGFITPG